MASWILPQAGDISADRKHLIKELKALGVNATAAKNVAESALQRWHFACLLELANACREKIDAERDSLRNPPGLVVAVFKDPAKHARARLPDYLPAGFTLLRRRPTKPSDGVNSGDYWDKIARFQLAKKKAATPEE